MNRYEQVPQAPQEQRDYADALRVIAEVSIETMADIEREETEAVEDQAKKSDKYVIYLAGKITEESAPMPPVQEAEKITYNAGVYYPKVVVGQAESLTSRFTPQQVLDKAEDITHEYGVRLPLQLAREAENIATRARKEALDREQKESEDKDTQSYPDSDGGLPATVE